MPSDPPSVRMTEPTLTTWQARLVLTLAALSLGSVITGIVIGVFGDDPMLVLALCGAGLVTALIGRMTLRIVWRDT